MRNAVKSDVARAAQRIAGVVGDMDDHTCGYLVSPVGLTSEVVEGAYRILGSGGQTIDAFIDSRGGDAALRDAVGALLSGARTMASNPVRMTGKMLGAAAMLVPDLMMRWDEVHLADEFLFYISAEQPGTSRHWRQSSWRTRLIERLATRMHERTDDLHEEMREVLMFDKGVGDADVEDLEEAVAVYQELTAQRRILERRIVPHDAEALISAHEDDAATPQWIAIELGDCRLENGRLKVRTHAPWHAPDEVIDRVAEAVERMLDVVSHPGGRLDAELSRRRRKIAEKLHHVPQAALLDVKVNTLSQEEGGKWTGSLNLVSDVAALDMFGIPTIVRIQDHAYDSSDKGMPKSFEGLERHQRRIVDTMAREHRYAPFTVDAVLARAMARIDATGLATALRTPARTPGAKARLLGLPPEFRTIEAVNGRLIGRIALSPTVFYRDGAVRVRGVSLPQAALASLPGMPIGALVDSPLLGSATIRTAKGTASGVVVKIDVDPDVPFDDIVGEAVATGQS